MGRNQVKRLVSYSTNEKSGTLVRSDNDEFKFIVKGIFQENTRYEVNLKIGICDCKIGQTGKVCKHQIRETPYGITTGFYKYSRQKTMTFWCCSW